MFAAFGMARRRKTSPQEAPRHPLRRSLLDVIRRRPGINETELGRLAGINRGTTQYHLLVLARIGAVAVARTTDGRHYFPPDMDPQRIPPMALLMRGRVLEVARAIIGRPGITQTELTHTLPISRRVFREYADLLDQYSLIEETPSATSKRYFPTPELVELVAAVDRPLGVDDQSKPPLSNGGSR